MSRIGVFDSGIGGLTILKALTGLLPAFEYCYVADSGFAPYGSKPREYIIDRSNRITCFLIDKGCDLIVVACNTATGAAIAELRENYPVPFVGVEPAVKPAAMESQSGHIGVLATRQTFQSEHFQRTTGRHAQNVEVHVQPGDGFVELIESGMADSEDMKALLTTYVKALVSEGIDQLVLGCTHYPFLIPQLTGLLPEGVNIHDPAPAVARQVQRIVDDLELTESQDPGMNFCTTGSPDVLKRLILDIWGGNYRVEQISI